MCDTDSMRKQVLAQRDMLGPGEKKRKEREDSSSLS